MVPTKKVTREQPVPEKKENGTVSTHEPRLSESMPPGATVGLQEAPSMNEQFPTISKGPTLTASSQESGAGNKTEAPHLPALPQFVEETNGQAKGRSLEQTTNATALNPVIDTAENATVTSHEPGSSRSVPASRIASPQREPSINLKLRTNPTVGATTIRSLESGAKHLPVLKLLRELVKHSKPHAEGGTTEPTMKVTGEQSVTDTTDNGTATMNETGFSRSVPAIRIAGPQQVSSVATAGRLRIFPAGSISVLGGNLAADVKSLPSRKNVNNGNVNTIFPGSTSRRASIRNFATEATSEIYGGTSAQTKRAEDDEVA
nr:uncharacterized protein LOC129383197 [Dermacentor andersoni]